MHLNLIAVILHLELYTFTSASPSSCVSPRLMDGNMFINSSAPPPSSAPPLDPFTDERSPSSAWNKVGVL